MLLPSQLSLGAALAVAVAATTAAAGGNRGALPQQPTTVTIEAPKKLAKIRLPKGLPQAPPADKWWERAAPCPDGATLDTHEAQGWSRHSCRDADNAEHGPYTSLDSEGRPAEDGWFRHGMRHGVQRQFYNGNMHTQRTYVDGVEQGPAIESQSTGSYRAGKRHGRWTLVTNTGTRQHGYFVNGKREGTWLAVIAHRGRDIVVGRAAYRGDTARGTIVWWTERGDVLATIQTGRDSASWQFYSKGNPTLAASCVDEQITGLEVERRGKRLSCAYTPDGALAGARGETGRGAGCPESTSEAPVGAVCRADRLDPWALSSALRF